MPRLIGFVLVLFGLLGCSYSGIVQHEVALGKGQALRLHFPQLPKGSLTQLLTTQYQQQSEQMLVRVESTPQSLKLVGLTTDGLDLFSIHWQVNQAIEYQKRNFLPEQLKPEYVLADFIMTYAALSHLQNSMVGSKIIEEHKNHAKLRSFADQGMRWLEIRYQDDSQWPSVEFENKRRDYRLSIVTLEWEADAAN